MMNDGFQFFDIILFAMIAGFILLRLRGVLGRRTGNERRRPNFLSRRRTEDGRFVPGLGSTGGLAASTTMQRAIKPERETSMSFGASVDETGGSLRNCLWTRRSMKLIPSRISSTPRACLLMS